MGLNEDLIKNTAATFVTPITSRVGRVVPETKDIALQGDAVTLDAAVLYADMVESTHLVSAGYDKQFPPKVFKAYLDCACRIIRDNAGVITAFDGDRVMAVFIDESRLAGAVKSAMQIHWAVLNIINPLIADPKYFNWSGTPYQLQQVVGIDAGKLLIARTGIRGSNDLVWVGKAANFAAKLCSLRESIPTWISQAVYDGMPSETRLRSDNKQNMWAWTTKYGETVYQTKTPWTIT